MVEWVLYLRILSKKEKWLTSFVQKLRHNVWKSRSNMAKSYIGRIYPIMCLRRTRYDSFFWLCWPIDWEKLHCTDSVVATGSRKTVPGTVLVIIILSFSCSAVFVSRFYRKPLEAESWNLATMFRMYSYTRPPILGFARDLLLPPSWIGSFRLNNFF